MCVCVFRMVILIKETVKEYSAKYKGVHVAVVKWRQE